MPGPSSSPQLDHLQFVKGLAAATGLDPKVIEAWTNIEGANAPGGTGGYNFLNVRASGSAGYSGVPIPSKSSNGFAQFASVGDAITETAYWINSMPNYATIRSSTKLGPRSQLAAIAASPWDAGHYGGGSKLYSAYAAVTKAGSDWLGKVGKAVGDAATGNPFAVPGDLGAGKLPGIGGPITALQAPVKIAEDVGTVVGLATNPQNWLRVGYIVGGGIMVLLGVVLLAKSVGALNIATPPTPNLDLSSGKPSFGLGSKPDSSGPIAGRSRTAQKRAGFEGVGRRPRAASKRAPGSPGSTRLAPGDSIPF